ncbi:MAG TPA: N-6 DNA methylase, partial [Trueperaceae bacterium]
DRLRDGVQTAIEALGKGFLRGDNGELKRRLREGDLSPQDYYRQLLRLVYRLLFLFVAEDRDLLHPKDADHVARARYRHYSTQSLRELAGQSKGGRHGDLYEALKVVMRALSEGGEPRLGLPELGGLLFSERSLVDLMQATLPNAYLLQAVRALAYTEVQGARRPVDYRNLGSEELGSVYESLLELHPEVDATAHEFELKTAAGHERKTTGSYYTPRSLINLLLDSALDPVIDDALRGKTSKEDAEKALLDLKVVDPAAGSGHFLIAAGQRLAKRLAAVRTGDDEPAPDAVRTALRDVIGRCIYGVDVNEMAAELCKVALWMEAMEPGKPLTFLEHHIRVGNSLYGTTRKLVSAGIPDAAFDPIEGDDRRYASGVKRRNREERGGQGALFDSAPSASATALATAFAELSNMPTDTPEQVQAKQAAYERLLEDERLAREQLAHDAWCAAFVWSKVEGAPLPVTTGTVRRVLQAGALDEDRRREVERLAGEYGFFHWHLAFPEVFGGGMGGFDVVLGNPPWDQIQLDPREFFAAPRPDVAEAPNMAARNRMIARLEEEDPVLFTTYKEAVRRTDGIKHFAHSSGRYPLSSFGRLNLAPLFAELSRDLLGPRGRLGLVVPTGIATDSFNQYFFQDLIESQSLVSLFDFENRQRIFPGIDSRIKFCLLTLAGRDRPAAAVDFVFFALEPRDVRDPSKRFSLTPEEIALLNPNTRTCPVFRSRRDAEITKAIYRRVPVLVNEMTSENPWGVRLMLMFMMNTDSGRFHTREQLEVEGFALRGNRFVLGEQVYLPLYEAKMMHQFDHRFATYTDSGDTRDLTLAEKRDPSKVPVPRYWVAEGEVRERLVKRRRDGGIEWQWDRRWLLGFRDITNSTNERTAIFSVVPLAGVGHTSPLAFSEDHAGRTYILAANGNSLGFDYVARQKVGGTHLTFGLLKQLAFLPPAGYTAVEDEFVRARVLELAYTAEDLVPFARDLGYECPPFPWDEERRFWLRTELDALYFHLYGISRDDVDYIMEAFPIVKRKDEAEYGCYRTKDAILEIYDEMARCRAEGREYQTRLDPPPAHPSLAHDPSTRPEWA